MLTATEAIRPPTTYVHRHEWRLYIVFHKDDYIIAKCDCGEEMSKEEAEAVLNNHHDTNMEIIGI